MKINGEVQESCVAKCRDRKSALKFLRKTTGRYGRPEVIVTDKLRFYGAAMKVIGNARKQETGRWRNNRGENSHQPFQRREPATQRFRQMKSLQKFAAVRSSIRNHFNLNLAAARLRHIAGTQWSTRKYMNMTPPYADQTQGAVVA